MSESAARAERLEFRSSNSPTYLWRVAAKPVAVRLSLEVVDHMAREILDNFRSVSARGSEIGGILLGSFSRGDQAEVIVQGYESIPCEYSRGPLYRLAEVDKQHFDEAIRAHEDGGLSVVGFFRSNTRKGLSLDAEDVAYMGSRFPDPAQIALLIRPFATKTSIAGIFLWENGTVAGEASPMEFPFSAVELERLQAAAASTAPQTKPQVRAQVVPIASRRETTNVAEATIELEIPVQEVAPPAPEPLPEPAPVTLPEEPAPSATAAVVVETQPARAEPIAAPSFGMPPAAKARDREVPPAESGGKFKWIGAGAVALLIGVALFVYPGFLRHSAPTPATTNSPKLALRAERTAGDLLVIWNRDAESVRTAVKAVLTISDGPQQENLVMDLAQLRNGSVVYTPATPDVSFRLEVTSSEPAKSQSELLRVLKTAAAEVKGAAKPAETAAVKPATPAPASNVSTEEATPRAPRTASRPFNAGALESPAARLRAARPSDLLEPPPPAGGSAAPSMSFTGAPASPVASPSAPPPPPPPVARPETTQPPIRVGGDVKPAELTVRREPVYPPLARQSRVEGAVMMEAKIGADGRVKEVKTLQGHPMLRNAAMDAVKQWTYRPAMLNGKAVESTSRVEVHFVGGR